MMTSNTMLGYLRAEPFRPFRIQMASGKTFEIRHPEMLRVGKNNIIVFTMVSDDPDVFDRWDTVSLMLIESVTHLDSALSAS